MAAARFFYYSAISICLLLALFPAESHGLWWFWFADKNDASTAIDLEDSQFQCYTAANCIDNYKIYTNSAKERALYRFMVRAKGALLAWATDETQDKLNGGDHGLRRYVLVQEADSSVVDYFVERVQQTEAAANLTNVTETYGYTDYVGNKHTINTGFPRADIVMVPKSTLRRLADPLDFSASECVVQTSFPGKTVCKDDTETLKTLRIFLYAPLEEDLSVYPIVVNL